MARGPTPTMHAQASSLSDQDIEIAAYLQVRHPRSRAPRPPQAKRRRRSKWRLALAMAQAAWSVEGLAPKPPVLAGQHVDYFRARDHVSQRTAQERRHGQHGAAADQR